MLLSYLNLFVHGMGTLLGCEHCMVLTSIASKQIIFCLIYLQRGALALSGLLWDLWVSGYSCLLKVQKKSYRGAGNWEQVSQSHVQQLQALQLYYYWQPKLLEIKVILKCCALCTVCVVGSPTSVRQGNRKLPSQTSSLCVRIFSITEFGWLLQQKAVGSFWYNYFLFNLWREMCEYFSWP